MHVRLFLIALPVFFLLDMLWLGVVARTFYQKQLGELMRSPVLWTPAILFYLIFLAGLVVFVIEPAVERKEWMRALSLGAFFGLITYATYDLTNLATLKNWPLPLVVVDLLWGTVLSASVSVGTYWLSIKFIR
jgi:uncharacterized membrane protein